MQNTGFLLRSSFLFGVALAVIAVPSIAQVRSETVLHSFTGGKDGAYPGSVIADQSGNLYGTTLEGGRCKWGGERLVKFSALCLSAVAIVSLLPARIPVAEAATESVVYSFAGGADGAWPGAALIDVNGTLFGTAESDTGCGTVFSLDPATGKETVVHSFAGGATDGCGPAGALILVKGALYGTTTTGGTGDCFVGGGCGTVFSIDPTTGTEHILYSFAGGSDGELPTGLVNGGAALYGATSFGGSGAAGTIFSIDPASGAENVLYSFCAVLHCTDGFDPGAGLIDIKGTLYGTTTAGGQNDGGTVFSFDTANGTERVLYSFCGLGNCADGERPYSVVLKMDGMLYGTTQEGGGGCHRKRFGCGTVYSLDLATGAESVLHAFAGGSDGTFPQAGLIGVNGTLYGTTAGHKHPGTVFSVDPATGAETVLYNFQGIPDGANPYAALVNVNGTLYGTTLYGGTGSCKFDKQEVGCGTVFSITP